MNKQSGVSVSTEVEFCFFSQQPTLRSTQPHEMHTWDFSGKVRTSAGLQASQYCGTSQPTARKCHGMCIILKRQSKHSSNSALRSVFHNEIYAMFIFHACVCVCVCMCICVYTY